MLNMSTKDSKYSILKEIELAAERQQISSKGYNLIARDFKNQ